ncbi:unnamed protein product, partial [Ectocarpus sp. 12 AP-2014]
AAAPRVRGAKGPESAVASPPAGCTARAGDGRVPRAHARDGWEHGRGYPRRDGTGSPRFRAGGGGEISGRWKVSSSSSNSSRFENAARRRSGIRRGLDRELGRGVPGRRIHT